MKKIFRIIGCVSAAVLLTGCFGSKLASSKGGEVTGASGRAFSEPTPYGMTLVKRGHLKMGSGWMNMRLLTPCIVSL